MIQEYYRLQIRRSNRYFHEFDVYPIIGYILVAIAFWGVSAYLFYKLSYATYFYFGTFLSTLIWIDRPESINFFKIIFTTEQFKIILIIEKIITALPFAIFLLYKSHIFLACLSLKIAIILALTPPMQYKGRTIPTPFSYHPYDFTIGIRNSYLLYIGLYFILFIAVRVDNFNLGIATLLATLVTSITFGSKLETESYIWNFSGSSYSFLKKKLILSIAHASLLSFSILGILMIIWPSQHLYIVGLQAIGYLYLITFILAKYTAYPRMMSLPQGLILVFCLWIPPLLLFVMPYLFLQSIRNLKYLLT